MSNSKKGFHTRGFISLLTGFSFFVVLLTGIVLYFVPQGKIAYWIDWRFLWLSKSDWGNIHITSTILFAVCACYHLFLNWKVFVSYLIHKINNALSLKKEQAAAAAITLFFVFGTIYYLPPLKYMIEFSDYLKGQWVSKELEPPFGHAEQLSLKTLAKRTNIDLNNAIAELRNKGFKVEGEGQSLADVAKKNGVSPMKVYNIMSMYKEQVNIGIEKAPKDTAIDKASNTKTTSQTSKKTSYTSEMIEELLTGKGIGKKTIDELCGELGVKAQDAENRLKIHGINIKKDETLKEIAARYNTTPIEIAKKAFADK